MVKRSRRVGRAGPMGVALAALLGGASCIQRGAPPEPCAPCSAPDPPAPPIDPASCVDPAPPSDEPAPDGEKAPAGRIRPESIQAVVRSHYHGFRSCYEIGLGRNPSLNGKVTIHFTIATDGKVPHARLSENELPDCAVARCVRDRFSQMEFPLPEGGAVRVVYPIVLQPG